jgi:hypothetical protein
MLSYALVWKNGLSGVGAGAANARAGALGAAQAG